MCRAADCAHFGCVWSDHVGVVGYRRLTRNLRNVFITRKHARNETRAEVYSHCCGHFRRQISHVPRLEPFHARSYENYKIKGIFSPQNIFKYLRYPTIYNIQIFAKINLLIHPPLKKNIIIILFLKK